MKGYTFLILSDRIAIKADPYQWIMCKRKGDRWIPKTYHVTLNEALLRVQDAYLRKARVSSIEELIDLIAQHNANLTDIVRRVGLTREITR